MLAEQVRMRVCGKPAGSLPPGFCLPFVTVSVNVSVNGPESLTFTFTLTLMGNPDSADCPR